LTVRNEFDGKISDGIHEAYAAAENLRLFLVKELNDGIS